MHNLRRVVVSFVFLVELKPTFSIFSKYIPQPYISYFGILFISIPYSDNIFSFLSKSSNFIVLHSICLLQIYHLLFFLLKFLFKHSSTDERKYISTVLYSFCCAISIYFLRSSIVRFVLSITKFLLELIISLIVLSSFLRVFIISRLTISKSLKYS